MKIKIGPINAGFINRVLVFNLSNKTINNSEYYFDNSEVSVVIIVDNNYGVGVNLENNTYFVFDYKVDDKYGPYESVNEAINKHLFGKYDGIKYVFSGIKKLETSDEFEFVFYDFVYNTLTFNFTTNIKKITQKLRKTIKKIDQPFVFTFEPETWYAEGVVESALISLDNVFNKNNFNDKYIVNENFLLKRIDRLSMDGVIADNKNSLVIINNNPKKHINVFIPKLISKNYFNIVNKITDEEFFKEIVKEGKEKVEFKFLKYVDIVTPDVEPTNINLVLSKDNKFYSVKIDLLNKQIILQDFVPYVVHDYNVFLLNGKLCVSKEKYITIPNEDIVLKTEDDTFLFNRKNKTVKSLSSNFVFDYEYLSNVSVRF